MFQSEVHHCVISRERLSSKKMQRAPSLCYEFNIYFVTQQTLPGTQFFHIYIISNNFVDINHSTSHKFLMRSICKPVVTDTLIHILFKKCSINFFFFYFTVQLYYYSYCNFLRNNKTNKVIDI